MRLSSHVKFSVFFAELPRRWYLDPTAPSPANYLVPPGYTVVGGCMVVRCVVEGHWGPVGSKSQLVLAPPSDPHQTSVVEANERMMKSFQAVDHSAHQSMKSAASCVT